MISRSLLATSNGRFTQPQNTQPNGVAGYGAEGQSVSHYPTDNSFSMPLSKFIYNCTKWCAGSQPGMDNHRDPRTIFSDTLAFSGVYLIHYLLIKFGRLVIYVQTMMQHIWLGLTQSHEFSSCPKKIRWGITECWGISFMPAISD